LPSLAFDLDGTLLDSQERQVELGWRLAQEEGAGDWSPSALWEAKRRGLTTAQALEELGVDHELAQRIATRWVALVEDPEWLERDRVLPGARAALEAASAADCRVVVLTARRSSRSVVDQISRLGLDALIDDLQVVAPEDASEAKTEALRASRPVALVGDTESDAEAALRAGIRFAAVGCGQRSPEFLTARGCGPVYPDAEAAVRALLMELELDPSGVG
jgi:phosphoglycolate phosphatase-like HAD superfamily hydrolase